ncbi:MAG: ankyrin repeat domain-containing protein [Syntrophomonas sp.]
MFGDGSEYLKTLLDAGANPNIISEHNETSLMTASRYDDPEYIQTLLAVGVDPNVQHENGSTALISKIYYMGFEEDRQRHLQGLSLLLEVGANPNIRDNEGHSALYYANLDLSSLAYNGQDKWRGHKNCPEAAQLLRQYGATE